MARRLSLTQLARLALKRSGAYKRLFLDNAGFKPDASVVLADLRRFCRADGRSTFTLDDPSGRTQALLEGRREVFERIMAYIHANDDQIHYLQEQIPSEE